MGRSLALLLVALGFIFAAEAAKPKSAISQKVESYKAALRAGDEKTKAKIKAAGAARVAEAKASLSYSVAEVKSALKSSIWFDGKLAEVKAARPSGLPHAQQNALIIGAGPAGLCTAYALWKNGWAADRITVVEARSFYSRRNMLIWGSKFCGLETFIAGAPYKRGKIPWFPVIPPSVQISTAESFGRGVLEILGVQFVRSYAVSSCPQFGTIPHFAFGQAERLPGGITREGVENIMEGACLAAIDKLHQSRDPTSLSSWTASARGKEYQFWKYDLLVVANGPRSLFLDKKYQHSITVTPKLDDNRPWPNKLQPKRSLAVQWKPGTKHHCPDDDGRQPPGEHGSGDPTFLKEYGWGGKAPDSCYAVYNFVDQLASKDLFAPGEAWSRPASDRDDDKLAAFKAALVTLGANSGVYERPEDCSILKRRTAAGPGARDDLFAFDSPMRWLEEKYSTRRDKRSVVLVAGDADMSPFYEAGYGVPGISERVGVQSAVMKAIVEKGIMHADVDAAITAAQAEMKDTHLDKMKDYGRASLCCTKCNGIGTDGRTNAQCKKAINAARAIEALDPDKPYAFGVRQPSHRFRATATTATTKDWKKQPVLTWEDDWGISLDE